MIPVFLVDLYPPEINEPGILGFFIVQALSATGGCR
jgi:hypothetical protein